MSGRTASRYVEHVPTITLEDHAPPIVRILGVTLRRAATQPRLARRMGKLRGRVALRSTTDPQAVTITFDKGAIHLTHGVHDEADVVIGLDFNTMGQPGAAKPTVKGAARHPALALGAAKVLDPPTPGGWKGAVDAFWSWAAADPTCPGQLRVVCTDDGDDKGDVVKGGPGGTTLEVHGPAYALLNVFTGGDHFGAALLEGRVRAVGDFPTLTQFTGLITRLLLGDA
jgi:hypothetical protein